MGKRELTNEEKELYVLLDKAIDALNTAIKAGDSEDIVTYRRDIKGLVGKLGGEKNIVASFRKRISNIL